MDPVLPEPAPRHTFRSYTFEELANQLWGAEQINKSPWGDLKPSGRRNGDLQLAMVWDAIEVALIPYEDRAQRHIRQVLVEFVSTLLAKRVPSPGLLKSLRDLT